MRLGGSKEGGATLEAIEAIYRQRLRAFLRVAAGVAGPEWAADAVHNGFVRALRHRRSFRGESSLESWIWRTIINAAHDLRAGDGARRLVPFDDSRDEREEQMAQAGGGSGPASGLHAAVLALSPRQRAVVFLRYYADLDYRTIAEVLEVQPGTVAATLHSAHTAIRKQLQEEPTCRT